MPKFTVPCWINMKKSFDIEVEASTPINAILELHKMLESSDLETIDYIESCIDSGIVEGFDGPVDFNEDPSNVFIVKSKK